MSRIFDFLCLNGTEVAYSARTASYIRNGLVGPGWEAYNACDECDLITDGDVYLDPATDDAPWYDTTQTASMEFFGILPTRIELLTVLQRQVANRASGGGIVGPLVPKPRVLAFQGVMVASSQAGMMYGERWLNEVLSGSNCLEGCASDEATILPYCPSDDYADSDLFLRRLLDVGIVDGPVFQKVNDLPECKINAVSFQLAAGQPYLFSPAITCLDAVSLTDSYGGDTCCHITTTDWPGDAVANITLTANTDTTGIHLSGKPTFDDGYGVMCPHDDGEPCWELDIPELPQDGILTIDSARQEIRYRSPSLKIDKPNLRMVAFNGPLTFPEISPCSDFCICAEVESGDVSMTVDKIIREL